MRAFEIELFFCVLYCPKTERAGLPAPLFPEQFKLRELVDLVDCSVTLGFRHVSIHCLVLFDNCNLFWQMLI